MSPEQLRQYLSFYQDLGLKEVYRRTPAAQPAAARAVEPAALPTRIELPPLAPSR